MKLPSAHPRDVLFADGMPVAALPACDHYCGTLPRMQKALALQAELGPVFDVTLDCEDGAPVGGEAAHARLCAELVMSSINVHGRVGVRVHPVDHPAFVDDVATLIGIAGERLAYVMLPKPRHLADVQAAISQIDKACASLKRTHTNKQPLPIHTLIETHGALRDVFAIAALPRIESMSFGLMDFVSSHNGAIPAWAMTATGQFDHPLVIRAKLEIAAACHAYGKTPSHCVVTEFEDTTALQEAAQKARGLLGYTRMWSIHPAQIKPIVQAFAPTASELIEAINIMESAQAANWGPTRFKNTLHDRASYRYFWQVIERAQRSAQAGGPPLPAQARKNWFD
jgi:citrate lyase subunit beta / citryl-CoA lyase